MKKDKKSWQNRDPHAARESRRYENPIPSREFLIEQFTEAGKPLRFEALADRIGIEAGPGRDALLTRLDAMVRDGQLVRDRRGAYGPVSEMDLVAGRVIGHRDGFGFLVPDEGGDDVFLGPRQMKALMHGDRAVVRVRGVDHRGRREGSLVDVLERNTRQVVGRYFSERGVGFVVPDHAKMPLDVVIPQQFAGDAKSGQMVVAELIEQPSKSAAPIGKITEVLGDHMAPGMEIDVAIRAHGIPHEWPADALADADAFGDSVPANALEGRVDLRDTPLVTIDGADARDFDDAVFAEPAGNGWKLLVAIAHVSAYVERDTALDREAQNRATSVYFPENVVPMLPETLSNGLCSLNPHVERLCLVCEMRVDDKGRVTGSKFYEAVMKSAARLTYDDVDAVLFQKDPAERKRREPLLGPLEALADVFRALFGARQRRGAIDFDSQETKILFGPERKIARIEPTVRTNAHRLIEECMIAANVEAARFLKKHKLPTLYRVHDKPKAEKLENLRLFLGGVGLSLSGGASPETKDYQKLLDRTKDRPDAALIQALVLRSMPQAVYSPKNIGHFGLAHEWYAHFTSPIRRYPDLLVHRAIRHQLSGAPAEEFPYGLLEMERLGDHCSMCERRADDATRDVVAWLKAEYALDRVGDEFDGTVTAVTAFGMFVLLDEVHSDGLVHVSSLGDDFYHFDPVRHSLTGQRAGRRFQLGDRVRVRITEVNLDERKIDLELVGVTKAAPASPKGERKGKAKGKGGDAKPKKQGGRSRRR